MSDAYYCCRCHSRITETALIYTDVKVKHEECTHDGADVPVVSCAWMRAQWIPHLGDFWDEYMEERT